MQAHDATAVVICKKQDCPNEAPSRGRYAGYCDEHRHLKANEHNTVRGTGPVGNTPRPGRGGVQPIGQRLRELAKMADQVDRAKAKAAKATAAALKLKQEADDLERQLRERTRLAVAPE